MIRPDFARRLDPRVRGHVLVVGAGGIGCPAAWALRAVGVGRITLVDPDVVELSNLPRQVLYTAADLGAPKAAVAARVLGGEAAGIAGVHARLDETNEAALLEEVDVVLDATDGALTKDWLNQLAVRRGVPLIHAAGVRSEARLLPIPAGGAPCLACLFGRLEAETGSCADLGVWNGVVGTIGFLAAHAALQQLRGTPPARAYSVLDFQTPSTFALDVRPADPCPVCTDRAARVEPYPEDAACAVTATGEEVVLSAPDSTLDLREERCPMNLLRARKALEQAGPGHVIDIELGEEGAATVPDGVRALGHEVLREEPRERGLRVLVRRGEAARADAAFDDDTLRRFARQLVLPEVGDGGQQRLCAARVRVASAPDIARDVACVYLRAAGVQVDDDADADVHMLPVHDAPTAVRMARAAAWADALQRALVGATAPRAPLAIDASGRV